MVGRDSFVRAMRESVTIILQDVEKEDWSAAGALMADKYPD